jgi:hypothetical protein
MRLGGFRRMAKSTESEGRSSVSLRSTYGDDLKLMLDFEQVIARVVQRSPLRLVAIDGLPLAGK